MINTYDFYLSVEQPCNYLKNVSQNIFLDPNESPDVSAYQQLLELGFRRSGSNVYRPNCSQCSACLSVRVDVNQFIPKKSQKRCLKKNSDIYYKSVEANFSDEHYYLYSKYLKSRHKGEGMDDSTEEDYMNFLSSTWSPTQFIEFRFKDDNRLLGVAVTDFVDNALSSVYTFFETEEVFNKRSLGVFAILCQIEYARSNNLDWVYLGYWIKDNQKMSYKNQYKPAQYLFNGHWHNLAD